jgi:hypothetical protein
MRPTYIVPATLAARMEVVIAWLNGHLTWREVRELHKLERLYRKAGIR